MMDVEGELVYTPHALNFSCFVVGMVIVWIATHNWLAMLGSLVASIHVAIKVKPEEVNK